MSVQSVNAKTISRLEQSSSLTNESLFVISQPSSDDKWVTKSTSMGDVVNFAETTISANIKTNFGLDGMNVQNLKQRVDNLYSANVTLNGTKTFGKTPLLNQAENNKIKVNQLLDNAMVTKSNVKDLFDTGGMFIGSDSQIEANPDNDSPNTEEDDKLLIWRIPDGMNDSTQYKNDYGILTQKDGVTCDRTGNLVVYGWLADGGGVLPQEAWVALYGKIKNKEDNNTGYSQEWTILQLQPWTVSDRSKVIQYVGFNIPVRKGLQLKIKTGFSVNSTATATNSGNSLVFPNVQHNTFVGYIVTQN